jgi:hypothetical protein
MKTTLHLRYEAKRRWDEEYDEPWCVWVGCSRFDRWVDVGAKRHFCCAFVSKQAVIVARYSIRTFDYAFDDSFAMEVWSLVANTDIP